MPDVIAEIAAERRRQVEVEGWTAEHDDQHDRYQMALAAACYAARGGETSSPCNRNDWIIGFIGNVWPWAREWWKPKDRRRDLIRAGALIVAEIERLDRISAKNAG